MAATVRDSEFQLSNGVLVPGIALGTWQMEKEAATQAVRDAVSVGYRHIDTASNYLNEEYVGKALRDPDIRKDIFLVSKLRAEIKSYDGAIEAFEGSIRKLGTDYLDLYLIHAPWPWTDEGKDCTEGNIAAWKALIDLYNAGRIRSIGVSNFHPEDIDPIVSATGFMPMVNQIRFFIGNTQERIVRFCKDNGILVEAYSPLATGKLMAHPDIVRIAEKYGVTAPQLCIRYCVDRGTLPIVKSLKKDRMIQNLDIDFVIAEEDLAVLNAVQIPQELKRNLRS